MVSDLRDHVKTTCYHYIISFLIVSYLVVIPSVAMLILRKHLIQLIENAYGTNSPGMALMDPFCPPYKAYMRSINAV